MLYIEMIKGKIISKMSCSRRIKLTGEINFLYLILFSIWNMFFSLFTLQKIITKYRHQNYLTQCCALYTLSHSKTHNNHKSTKK